MLWLRHSFSLRSRVLWCMGVLLVLCLGVALGLGLFTGGSPAVASVDMAEVEACVQGFHEALALTLVVPTELLSSIAEQRERYLMPEIERRDQEGLELYPETPLVRLPENYKTELQATYERSLRQVCVDEGLSQSLARVNAGGQLEEYLNDPFEQPIVKEEHQVLSVNYLGAMKNGDIVVSARTWNGEEYADGTKMDIVSTWEYLLRAEDDTWQVVTFRAATREADASSTGYGPKSPHDEAEWLGSPGETLVEPDMPAE